MEMGNGPKGAPNKWPTKPDHELPAQEENPGKIILSKHNL